MKAREQQQQKRLHHVQPLSPLTLCSSAVAPAMTTQCCAWGLLGKRSLITRQVYTSQLARTQAVLAFKHSQQARPQAQQTTMMTMRAVQRMSHSHRPCSAHASGWAPTTVTWCEGDGRAAHESLMQSMKSVHECTQAMQRAREWLGTQYRDLV